MAAVAIATAELGRSVVTTNQFDRRLTSAANWSPVRTTSRDDPTSVRESTRPPQSPYPFRAVTEIASRVPSWGKVAWMVDTGIEVFQVWFGLQAPATPGGHTESPRSGTAGNDGKFGSGAEYPPEEAEYSVVSGTPLFPNSMT